MKTKSYLITATVLLLMAVPAWATSKVKTLHAFNGADGEHPNASVLFDSAGNLYGTTADGGANGLGNVFKLSRGTNGRWTETVLHDFNQTDGANPEGGLIFDSAGNLYGTTSSGGVGTDGGTVFKLAPGTNGKWTYTVLYSFFGTVGLGPWGSLIFDAAGNLYGTAYQGGPYSQDCYSGCGTVFEVSPSSGGQWTGKALHIFTGAGDGSYPFCTLIFDPAGNLYGTTTGSSTYTGGTVFKLTPGANGLWTQAVLHQFNGLDGDTPYAGVVFDPAGNLYGTTWLGGSAGAGTVFKLTPGQSGTWSETVLHSFNNKDGSFVYAGVAFDAAGNLWGTTSGYGSDLGSAYKLVPNQDGTWGTTVLQTFRDRAVNGGVVFDGAGNAYSTSSQGGNLSACGGAGCGTVFEVVP